LEIDWKIPTTASVWRQLEKFLWPEVHKWARRLKWDQIGRKAFDDHELLSLALKLDFGEAFAIASDNPETLEGAHASEILYIFDEAKIIPDPTWDSVEGAFSTGNAYWLAGSTPGTPNGRFYDICSRKAGYQDWYVNRVTLDEAIESGRINKEWAEARRRQWGENSSVFKNRVLGEFAAQETDSAIPLAWVEQANERWQKLMDAGWRANDHTMTSLGADIARYGEDKTCLALRYSNVISHIERFDQQDTMTTTGKIVARLRDHAEANVDVIGLGAGVVDRLRELGIPVNAFNSAEATDGTDISGERIFLNKRAEAWWHLRELLDPDRGEEIALPPDDLLIGDLTAPRWKETSNGRIQIESKDDIRKRLGRSTDSADAVIMAFYNNFERTGIFV